MAAIAAAAPGAHAKGWSGPWYFLSGDAWHRRTEVKFRSLDGVREAMKTEYFAYMIEANRAPVEPDDLRVGRVLLTRDEDDELTLRAETRFVIPDIVMGRYVVTFCTLGCKSALGRFAPTFFVPVVENEAQRALYSWLDDWLQVRRGLEFFDNEVGRIASMTDVVRRSDATQEWHLRSLKERVKALEAGDRSPGSLSVATFVFALLGGALGWSGTRIVAAVSTRLRQRRMLGGVTEPEAGSN